MRGRIMNKRDMLVERARSASEAARQLGCHYTSRALFEVAMKLEALPPVAIKTPDQYELLETSE